MQTNNDDMVIDHPVSVCACQMQIEGDNDLDEHAMDEDLDQGFCDEAMDEDFDEDFDYNQNFAYEAIDPDGFDYNQGFAYEPMDQGFAYEPMDQGFAQSEIHIEFPERASIRFAFANGVRYLVLTNM